MPDSPYENDWQTSLWRESPEKTPGNPSLEGQIFADVAVVGAGFTGLRAASVLAESGVNVVVVEAKDVGWGASGRSGGQVNPMLPFNSPERIRQIVGDDKFEAVSKASLNSATELFEFIEKYQIRCGARQNGWLRVLHSESAYKAAQTECANWNSIGGDMHLIEGAEVARLSGSNRYKAGVVTTQGGAVQPFDLVCGLAEISKQAGVRIFGQTPVLKLMRSEANWHLETPNGSVVSKWAIIATNGYTNGLVPGLAESIVPMTPIQMSTEPLPDDIYKSILPQGHTISDSRRIIMYARREPGNRIVYGGLGRIKNRQLDGFDWLKRDAVKVFPQLSGAKWSHAWGGRIALTKDYLPHIHEPQENLIAGLGYNGRGVAMSFVVGRNMAERILGKNERELDLPVTQIRPFPLRSIKMLGMETAISVMRLMDRLEFR
ncbi:MAG: FAD-binding oxidoreductase [Pseudomonadota bacterium]